MGEVKDGEINLAVFTTVAQREGGNRFQIQLHCINLSGSAEASTFYWAISFWLTVNNSSAEAKRDSDASFDHSL